MPDETRAPADVERRYGRYREAVDDWASFAEAMRVPLPPVAWARPGRLEPAELEALLGIGPLTTVSWSPDAARLPEGSRPGLHWAHTAGLLYVQEEASLLPVRMLDVRPGDKVLDLCAAPGGKTARIAFALQNRGTVIANDRVAARHAATGAAVLRLGLSNVTSLVADGAVLPDSLGSFDRVLVDAPCSSDGRRRGDLRRRGMGDRERASLATVQRALLERAIALCRPGGRIVYSTCTLAPEENEAVVDAVLRRCADVHVAPVPIDGLETSPGLPGWNGHTFHPSLASARRLWPHLSGTGGFFAVALDKAGGGHASGGTPVCDVAPDARESDLLKRFTIQFGIPETSLEGLRLLEWGQYARLVADDHVLPGAGERVSTGLTVTRNRARGPKLSTASALSLGRHATRQLVQLTAEQAARYQARESLHLADHQLAACDRDGYVIARVGPHALGLGLLRRGPNPVLASEFPKAW